MYFLFGEEVYERTKELHATLKGIVSARVRVVKTYVEKRKGPEFDAAEQDLNRAIAKYEEAMDDLRRAVRSEMALPSLPPPVAY